MQNRAIMESTIEDLKDDELLNIFSFLDEDSLMESRYVCERWRKVIDENPQIYRDIVLKVEAWNCSPYAYNYFDELNYENLKINVLPQEYINYEGAKEAEVIQRTEAKRMVEEILEYHKERIKIAEFYIAGNLWDEWISGYVAKLKNIQKLTFGQALPWNARSFKTDPIFLPELKELDMYEKYPIVAPTLETLTIRTPSMEIIKTFPKLKHLKLLHYYFNWNFNTVNFEQILQKLFSFIVCINDCPQYESILNFFAEQRENLKEFAFKEFAVYEMKLEKLTLSIPVKFEAKSKPNNTIKFLRLIPQIGQKFNEESAYKIIASCPMVETLSIEHLGAILEIEILEIAKKYLPNLTELILTWDTDKIPKIIDLNTVERITIKHMRDGMDNEWIGNFERLILCCKNLKKIRLGENSIRSYERRTFPDEPFLKILNQLKNLEEIHATEILKLSPNVVEFLITNQVKVKILKFCVQEKELEQQKELSARLSRGSNIQCTIYQVNVK